MASPPIEGAVKSTGKFYLGNVTAVLGKCGGFE